MSHELCYHDYLALIAFVNDFEVSRIGSSLGRELFNDVGNEFTTICCRYREKLERNRRHYIKANSKSGSPFDAPSPIDDALYSPICLFAYGNTDSLCLTLLDDFDPLLAITSEFKTGVDQVSIAFCPKIESLELPKRHKHHLRDLDDLIDKCPRKQNGEYKLVTHSFEKDTPLVAVTRFKVGGLATLGQGMIVQRALFRAMAKRIDEAITQLKRERRKKAGLLYSVNDLDDIWVSFLDSQGAAEITTVIGCRNYSIAMSIVASLRTLTMQHVFDQDARIFDRIETGYRSRKSAKKSMEKHELFEAIYSVSKDVPKKKNRSIDLRKLIPGNHVFSTSYTTLAASGQTLVKPQDNREGNGDYYVGGYVDVNSCFNLNPGHFVNVESRLVDRFVKQDGTHFSATELGKVGEIHPLQVGRHDMSFAVANGPKENSKGRAVEGVLLSEFFQLTHSLFEEIQLETFKSKESGLQDVMCTVITPLPDIPVVGQVELPEFHRPLTATLRHIQKRLRNDDKEWDRPTGVRGQFDGEMLEKSLKRLGIPKALRYSIIYLYQDFTACIGESLLFDSVLDLYDGLSTFYKLLTETLIKEQDWIDKERKSLRFEKRYCFTQERVDELTNVVTAFDNALRHRISINLSQSEISDMSIDLRGGLNQIIHATDAPLKCGMGLLKWLTRHRKLKFATPRNERDRVGAVTALTFQPKTQCHQTRFVSDNPDDKENPVQERMDREYCLAHLDVNVGHIFHPLEFITYFHEAAHLIRQQVETPSEEYGHFFATAQSGNKRAEHKIKQMSERIEESYANYLTFLFVFDGDQDTFLKHQFSLYSINPISRAPNDVKTMMRFIEVAFRMFLVVDAVDQNNKRNSIWHGAQLTKTQQVAARGRYAKVLRDYGCFFVGFDLATPEKWQEYAEDYFEGVFLESFNVIRPEWENAQRVYQEYREHAYPWMETERGPIVEEIRCCLKNGNSMVADWIRWKKPGKLQKHFGRKKSDDIAKDPALAMDDLMLVCDILYAYAKDAYEDLDPGKRIHLSRDEEGEVTYKSNGDKRPWNVRQLGAGYSGHFFADPAQRREELAKQIAVLKKLWDVSSEMRSRRLVEIIKRHWPM